VDHMKLMLKDSTFGSTSVDLAMLLVGNRLTLARDSD